MVCPYCGILLRNKNEQNVDKCNDLDELQGNYMNEKRQSQKIYAA